MDPMLIGALLLLVLGLGLVILEVFVPSAYLVSINRPSESWKNEVVCPRALVTATTRPTAS